MPKESLPARVRRRPKNLHGVGSPLLRQWKLLERLSSDSEGSTVHELANTLGVDSKTIRRDLIQFKRVGFDVAETVGKHGRKYWRILPRFETLRSKRQRYRAMRDSLTMLIAQSQTLGDQRLAADLEAIRKKVARKCK